MKYTDEEKEVLAVYESGRLKLRDPNKNELAMLKSAAVNTFKKDKRVTLRLYDHDLAGIQKKALQLGVPYQTLISGLIHSYVEGDLVYAR